MHYRFPSPRPGGVFFVAGLVAAVAITSGVSPRSGTLPLALGPAAVSAAETPAGSSGAAPDTARSAPRGAAPDKGDKAGKGGGAVLATVNGVPVTRQEFEAEVERLPQQYRPLADTPEGRRQILDNLIVKRLLWARAREQGLDKDARVRAQVEAYAQQAAVAALVNREVEKAGGSIPEAELKAYYDSHQDEFRTPEAIRASHILVETEAEAKAVREQLAAGKEDFAEVAKRASKDTGSAARGGDLGFFTKDRMVPEFANAAFALQKVGDLSPVVKTQFGYHVIKLTDRRPAGVRSFAEVKAPLEAQLREERQRAAVDKLIEEVRGKAKIEVNDARLAE